MRYFFAKVVHSDLVLLGMTYNGKLLALMEFIRSRVYEKKDMVLT